MNKGMLSIFRKAEVAKAEESASSKLAMALYGPAARPAPPAVTSKPSSPVSEEPRARLVFGIDATASRQRALATSAALTEEMLEAMPGELDVALAVHGGNRVHTFTPFFTDAFMVQELVAGIRCKTGHTRMLDILERVLKTEGVSVVVYVGDTFEEDAKRARKVATALGARGTRLIILHDTSTYTSDGAEVFSMMAKITSGAVLPFDSSALPKLRELLSAVAVLAVGGTELLVAKQEAMPAARLLLAHLKEKGEEP
jgi:hypothetical protein